MPKREQFMICSETGAAPQKKKATICWQPGVVVQKQNRALLAGCGCVPHAKGHDLLGAQGFARQGEIHDLFGAWGCAPEEKGHDAALAQHCRLGAALQPCSLAALVQPPEAYPPGYRAEQKLRNRNQEPELKNMTIRTSLMRLSKFSRKCTVRKSRTREPEQKTNTRWFFIIFVSCLRTKFAPAMSHSKHINRETI